jgi:N-methylhydantoinase B/oxoprolinase/acetone carboxylase alpha subunit
VDLELEIFRNLFVSIAEEMGVVLRRTAFSSNIKERRDYSCAVYDADAETIAMGDHMPVHLGAMPEAVREALAAHELEPGNVVFLNDPFRGGTHLPDITSVSGVFLAGQSKPAYYLATRAHHSDVGGMSPGSMPLASEIYQEGLRIPPVKLVRKGEFDNDLLEMILTNVRTPDERRGDLGAQLAAHHVGEKRLRESTEKYGTGKIRQRMADLKDYAERMMRTRIAAIPDGEYSFEDVLDDDGFSDEPIRIACTIRIDGDNTTVDFTASDPQTRGGVNANRAVTVSASMYVFRCLIREVVPYNAGLMRPLGIVTRPGSIVDAQEPASVAAGNVETSQRIVDVLLGALAQALPDVVPAASSGSMNNVTFGGVDPETGKPFAYYETIAGGMGATADANGLSGVHTHMTNSLNTPIEALEQTYSVLIREYAIRSGSGGDGKHQGGDGVVREYEFLTDTDITLLTERRKRAPYGLADGEPGSQGHNLLNGELLPSKVSRRINSGDRLRIETPGGGGLGSN